MRRKRPKPTVPKKTSTTSRAVRDVAAPVARAGSGLLPELRQLIQPARHTMAVAVNSVLTTLFLQIGTHVRREILREKRAAYSEEIVRALRAQLRVEFGRASLPGICSI
jgi:hypothetical protein